MANAYSKQPRPPHTFNNPSYNLPNGSTSGPAPGATALLPNNGRVIQSGSVRILCVADVRGNLKSLNELAKQARADHIIHTGDFGFYDDTSLDRIADKTLKHVAQYSPLLPESIKRSIAQVPPQQSIKQRFSPDQLVLSELPLLLNKQLTLDVPVYTVWGACEDVRVLEKFRSGEYKVDKLHIIDEASSRLLDVGGVKLRLLGLGGAVVMHKLFDNGEGKTTIAGGQGTMWTTLLQMGELVDTANRVYDPAETRIFVTHASPAREGMLNQLSVTLKADFSNLCWLTFSIWAARTTGPVTASNAGGQVDESAFKNMWNFNLADAAFGYLVLDIDGGRIGTEMRAQGFNFSHRGGKPAPATAPAPLAQHTTVSPISGGATGPGSATGAPSSQVRPPPQFGQMQAQPPRGTGSQYQPPVSQVQPPLPKPTPPKSAASPVPVIPAKEKPGTPQPAVPNVPASGNGASAKPASEPNGTIHASKPTESAPKPASPAEKKIINGLFISNVDNEEAIRKLFPDEDRAKILKIEKLGKYNNHVVSFPTMEDAKAALERQPLEHKKPSPPGPNRKPNVKMFEDRGGRRDGQGNAGTWQASNRGGGTGGQRSGYQSGSATSDGESGRGRGGFGGRGRGRGNDRGGRGRGGRTGGFGKGPSGPGESGSPTPTSVGGDKPTES
ncbi:predicted protein [Uncinocarpus reesii 1704]|uniref:Uncharacterized protein n=1 Tax=Uncinocarpus reesii (strain UAMH 1704) TaxID=336963 RepID=C4JHE7_UNCRE|nr:uncharacterized protein UREG_01310 [Uncinocarpus reesii 1704]EEP76461.1 predicted protein [Uncinocarpus reesii 1704]